MKERRQQPRLRRRWCVQSIRRRPLRHHGSKHRKTVRGQVRAAQPRSLQPQYQPAVRVWSFSSHGRSHRPLGWITGRVHHLLSDLEYRVFLILDWAQCVVDIREQFPLPIRSTLVIARHARLSHPWDHSRERYRPVTSDFVYAVKTNRRITQYVRALKYEASLAQSTQLRSLELERVYWDVRKTDWKIVLESQIPLDYVANIEWVRPYRQPLSLYPLTGTEIERIQRILMPALRRSRERCCDVTDWCDARLRLPEGTALAVVRYLIANRLLWVDMYARIIPTRPLIVLKEAQEDFLL